MNKGRVPSGKDYVALLFSRLPSGQDYVASLRFPLPYHGLSYERTKKHVMLSHNAFLYAPLPYESELSTVE